MQRLLVLGLSHLTAPLAVREKLVYGDAHRDAALLEFRDKFPETEALILSTCNRVEIYVSRPAHGHPRQEELAQFLAENRKYSLEHLQPHLYHKTDRQVVEHLFSVASSLDSMVLGETQILGQVRQAYEAAQRLNLTGSMLHPLFQRALAVGKEVLTQTPLAEGRLSVAGVAVDCARRIFDVFSDKTVLCIGAGKMSALMLTGLAGLSPGKLLVCNRDPARAAPLAQKFAGAAVPMEQLADHLVAADIILTSTGSTDPIITPEMFEAVMRRRRYKPVFLIDIAVPRDVAAGVGEMENVYLYDLDDLQKIVMSTRGDRAAAVESAQRIVQEHVEEFTSWHRTRQLGPLIDELYRRSHELAREELSRHIGKLGEVTESQRVLLEELTRRIVNKMLHEPVHTLRHAGALHGPTAQYAHAIEKLFKLHPPPDDSSKEEPQTPDGKS